MTRLRTSLPRLALYAALGGLIAHGCGSGDAPPSTEVAGNDSGTGGSGGNDAFIPIPKDEKCTDPTDSDGDGIADQIEDRNGGDSDGDGTPDRDEADSDDDGYSDADESGRQSSDPCSAVQDSDQDGIPDFQDRDSDNDGVPDDDETTTCTEDCRFIQDCDGDGVLDIVEVAAESDPCSGPPPADAELYFVVPFDEPEQTQRFSFSTGVKDADIYFLIDTTISMQPAIDDVRSSLDTLIIPTLLNGDPSASPPIPAIPGAWMGIGTFQDVPWLPWGVAGDDVYKHWFDVDGNRIYGNMSPPVDDNGTLRAPDNVAGILGTLSAKGGGDAPESTTQALWMAASKDGYRATSGGLWPPNEIPDPNDPNRLTLDREKWGANCDDSSSLGRACFRPGKLPVFVIITDAGFHNGPTTTFDYVPPPNFPQGGGLPVGGTKTYAAAIQALKDINAKIVGLSINTGTPGQARSNLQDLATQTKSLYFDPAFGGTTKPLVTAKDLDVSAGSTEVVSKEVVRLVGLLAGFGVNNVTTVLSNYDCAGSVDCDGDGNPDPEYHNFTDQQTGQPFDATQLIKSVKPVPQPAPTPYASIDDTTFFGVRGDKTVEFEVTAQNTVLQPPQVTVVLAQLRVQTPTGQALGGTEGVKQIYLVIPRYIPKAE